MHEIKQALEMSNSKYQELVFSFFMSGIMSLVISIFNVGLVNDIIYMLPIAQ